MERKPCYCSREDSHCWTHVVSQTQNAGDVTRRVTLLKCAETAKLQGHPVIWSTPQERRYMEAREFTWQLTSPQIPHSLPHQIVLRWALLPPSPCFKYRMNLSTSSWWIWKWRGMSCSWKWTLVRQSPWSHQYCIRGMIPELKVSDLLSKYSGVWGGSVCYE